MNNSRGKRDIRNVVRNKKRDYVGKIPKLRGGVWPKPTPYFSLFFPIQELIKWHNKFYKNGKKIWKFPNWGGGGPPLGNFSHIIPFFSLTTILTHYTPWILRDVVVNDVIFVAVRITIYCKTGFFALTDLARKPFSCSRKLDCFIKYFHSTLWSVE